MRRTLSGLILAATLLTVAPESMSARRRVVVRRSTVVVRPGHPIRRAVNRTVVVRAPRKTVVVGAPLVFLPPVVWAASVVSLPPRDRLVWEDSELIRKDEDWVDCNFGVDQSGDALFLKIDGRAILDFAEVTFENGNVQVVDFNERTHGAGIYQLLDFRDGRHVKTVRMLARATSNDARLTLYMRR
jgi:hypothetical protein